VRSSTDFGGLNLFLEEVAFWYYDSKQSSIAENDLLQRLASYLTSRGMLEGASRILDVFLKSGILEKRGNDIFFRYRSFQAFFLAKFAARNRQFAPKFIEDILRLSKEFALLCDLSRHDQDLLTFLEIVILERRPRFFDGVNKSSFMSAQFSNKKIEAIAELTMDALSNGPRSVSQIDEMHDFRDRAMAEIATSVRDSSSDRGTPPHVGRDGGYRFDLGWRKQGYFWEWDWTGQITLNRKENFFSTVLWL
jgi:hypothetical protein